MIKFSKVPFDWIRGKSGRSENKRLDIAFYIPYLDCWMMGEKKKVLKYSAYFPPYLS